MVICHSLEPRSGSAYSLVIAADGGIGAAGTAMEQQVHQPAAATGEQLSGDPLMRPGQIAAATSSNHKRMNRARTWLA